MLELHVHCVFKNIVKSFSSEHHCSNSELLKKCESKSIIKISGWVSGIVKIVSLKHMHILSRLLAVGFLRTIQNGEQKIKNIVHLQFSIAYNECINSLWKSDESTQYIWRFNNFSDTTITTAVPLANTTMNVYETTTPWLTTKQTSYIGMYSQNIKLYEHFNLENDHGYVFFFSKSIC